MDNGKIRKVWNNNFFLYGKIFSLFNQDVFKFKNVVGLIN